MRSGAFRILKLSAWLLAAWLLLKFLLPLIFPFLLGTGLALAAEPMARFFRRQLRLPRTAASAIAVSMTFCFLAVAGMILCALIVRELRALAGILPELTSVTREGLSNLEQRLIALCAKLPGELGQALSVRLAGLFSDGSTLTDKAIGYLLGLAGAILTHIPDSFLGIGTAVISGYMISAKLHKIRLWILRRLPREKLRSILEGAKRIRSIVFGYLAAQIKLSSVTFCLLLPGFLILKLPYAPLWALGVCLVDAFPVLGTGTVLLPWAALAAAQGNTALALGLGGLYAVVSITRSVLEPKLLGKQLGLDPLATLIAMYAGYRLFGLAGMILAPMVVVTLLQLLPARDAG